MRSYILFLLIVLSYLEVLNGQSYPMPENMPVHTKIFWGENGLFRKLNIAPKSRSSELRLRVKMLQLHQKIALGTLGLFSYQSYLGNQMIKGDYSNHSRHRDFGYKSPHRLPRLLGRLSWRFKYN